MSINVNSMNKADLVKLAMKKQSGKTATANQPSYMTKNGSIFNAPNAKQTTQTKDAKPTNVSDGIQKLNNAQAQKTEEKKLYSDIDSIKTAKQGREAINQLKQDMNGANLVEKMMLQKQLDKLEEKQDKLVEQEFENSQANLKSIARGDGAITNDGNASGSGKTSSKDGRDVSKEEGKAMAGDAEQENAALEKQTSETEKNTKEVEGYQKDATKTQKDVKKDEAKFNKDIAKETKNIKKNQTLMAKESEKMAQTKTEIDALQSELQSLTADSTGMGESSAFSLKLAGEQSTAQTNGASGNDDTASRIEELNNQIGVKTDSMQASGQKLQKLQTSTNKSITVMHNKVRLKSVYYKKAEKTMEAEQKTTDKIMKVANKIDDISQTVQQVGKTLQYVGKGMVITGQALASNPFTAAAGAALISAGGVVGKVGKVTELVGNYGSMAANITKTACNVADGNFAAALQTAGAAIQSGAAAAKGTKSLKNDMKAIDASVEQAKNQAAESLQAKEMAEQLKQQGASAGNPADAISSNAPTLDPNSPSGLADGLQTGTTGLQEGAGENLSFGQKVKNGISNGFQKAKDGIKEGFQNAKENIKDGFQNLGDGIKKAARDPDTYAKIGKQMSTLGAAMAQRSQQGGRAQGQTRGYSLPPQYNKDFSGLARGQDIMDRYKKRAA